MHILSPQERSKIQTLTGLTDWTCTKKGKFLLREIQKIRFSVFVRLRWRESLVANRKKKTEERSFVIYRGRRGTSWGKRREEYSNRFELLPRRFWWRCRDRNAKKKKRSRLVVEKKKGKRKRKKLNNFIAPTSWWIVANWSN